MTILLQQPFTSTVNQLDGDFSSIRLPPRSASAVPCKASEPFLVDVSKLRAFTLHRALRPINDNFRLEETTESPVTENDSIFAPSPQKPFSAILSLEAGDSDESACEEDTDFVSGNQASHTRTRTEELIMSELLSLTRPNSGKGKPTASAAEPHVPMSSGPLRGFALTPEPLGGLEGWLSRQNAKELAQLRNDFTPRPFQGSSQKYHTLPSTFGSRRRPAPRSSIFDSFPKSDPEIRNFGQASFVNPITKS